MCFCACSPHARMFLFYFTFPLAASLSVLNVAFALRESAVCTPVRAMVPGYILFVFLMTRFVARGDTARVLVWSACSSIEPTRLPD
jgi:hypothetical protein